MQSLAPTSEAFSPVRGNRSLVHLSIWQESDLRRPTLIRWRDQLVRPICLLSLLLALAGCQETQPPPPVGQQAANSPDSAPSASPPATDAAAALAATRAPVREIWDSIYMQGRKIGHQRLAMQPVIVQGRSLMRIDGEIVMRLQRGRDQVEQRIELLSLESPQGDVVRFKSQLLGGPQPQITRLRVEGETALIETSTGEQAAKEGDLFSPPEQLAWPHGVKGFVGVELSLAEKPLQPGEKRSLKTFMPLVNQIADVELIARDYESTAVPGGTLNLLRIEVKVQLPKQAMPPATVWLDRAGEQIKTATESLGQETFRTTKAAALSENEAANFDINAQTQVRVNKPLKDPHRVKQARYRVRLKGGDPSAAFLFGASQRVKRIDAETAEVSVLAIRPDSTSFASDLPPEVALPGDLSASNLIQSGDEVVTDMARQAAGDLADPWEIAVALEKHVRAAIHQKNYSTAFATAAEVARTKEGDCTEHAVLLAALARARGIPARVAMGLVYVAGEQAFLYHMWTEVLIDGSWIPLDATLGQGGIGCGHLKLAESNLQGASAYSSFLPIAQVLGRLKIEVLSAE